MEFAVFEVGLGGRLDATNIITPEVAVITRIDFDHENFLGHSLQEIAGEKAGILKPAVPRRSAPSNARKPARWLSRAPEGTGLPVCRNQRSSFASRMRSIERDAPRAAVLDQRHRRLAFVATQPARPVSVGKCTERARRRPHSPESRLPHLRSKISIGALRARIWPGRLERLQTRPDVYLDGAHNPGAARELAHFLQKNFAGRKMWLIYGAMRDKAVDEVAGLLFPHAAEVIFTEPGTPRAVSAAQLAEIAGHHAGSFRVIPNAEQALEFRTGQGQAGRRDLCHRFALPGRRTSPFLENARKCRIALKKAVEWDFFRFLPAQRPAFYFVGPFKLGRKPKA